MKFPSLSRPRREDTISALYGAIVAQARLPVFYKLYGVPDSVNGRLDMIMLHIFILYRRLAREAPAMQALGQGVFDHFCQDMDDNLREMGVGDLTVPKRMRRIGEAYYGRASAYEAALAVGDRAALKDALCRNVFEGAGENEIYVNMLASYLEKGVEVMMQAPLDALAAGRVQFPDAAVHAAQPYPEQA
jgi:cytochrome b pre-mRNA-processing protein 3